jgi:glyoxylase-like metal-dependent hydrolase (beta-lactamase superfamily II)
MSDHAAGTAAVVTLQEIAPSVHRLNLGRGVTETNVYVVDSGASWVLVDAGWPQHAPQVVTAAEALFGPRAAPSGIVLTHVHPDHSGAALDLVRRWDVPVYLHPDEVPFARGGYDPQHAHPLDRWVVGPLLRLLPPERVERARARSSLEDVAVAFDPDAPVPGMPDWRCVPTPGHTAGHAAYLRPSDGVLLSGDALLSIDTNSPVGLLAGRQGVYPPPRITTWDWSLALASVQQLLALDPTVLAGGHGPPVRAPSHVPRGAVVSEARIAAPPSVVFDYLTDLTREPEWNEQLLAVEPLTDQPLRAGSRFRVRFGRGVGDATIEYLELQRPSRWRTRSTSHLLDVDFVGAVTPASGGSHVRLVTELQPHGALRVAAPLLEATMRRSWSRHLATIRTTLEAEHGSDGLR